MRCVRARPSLATRGRRAHRGRSSEGCSCPYLFRWWSLREEWSCGAWWCSFPDKPPAHSENRWGRERGRSIPFLDKRPKTLLGLAIRARAEKHLCRYLWTVDFERLPPSDQAARVVIECAMLLSSRPRDRRESRAKSKPPPGDRGPTGFCARHNKRIIRAMRNA